MNMMYFLIFIGVLILCAVISLLVVWLLICWGINQKFGIYDPKYKKTFDYMDLDEEQRSRLVPGSNKLKAPEDSKESR